MKKVAFLVLMFFSIKFESVNAQSLLLNGNWKYSAEDSTQFSSIDYNDKNWASNDVKKLAFYEKEGTKPDRNRWFRKTIIIPSSLKSTTEKTGTLTLNLPDVYSEDVTYFNGKQVGKTEKTYYNNKERYYLIKTSEINWDHENQIAIRVHHLGTKGITGLKGIPSLQETDFSHFVDLAEGENLSNKILPNSQLINYSIQLTNGSTLSGKVRIEAKFLDAQGNELYTTQKDTLITVGKTTVSFPYQTNVKLLKVVYTLRGIDVAFTPSVLNTFYGYENIAYKPTNPVVANLVQNQFEAADISSQQIGGWLGEKIDANINQRLKHVDEKGLLAGYFNRPGNHPWIGEHIGKFLEAACNSYRYTKDAELKTPLDRMAQQLIATQLSDGYLGTYTPNKYWTSWDVWSHKYNLVGLLSYYQLSGYKPALTAAERIGDLLSKTFGTGKEQRDIVAAGEFGGMAATSVLEPIVDLYRFTGNKKYLDFAFYIIKSYDQTNGPKIVTTLNSVGRVDKVSVAKAYEMLSNLVGLAKLYKVTNDDEYLKPVLAAWNDIVKNRLYITGTCSSFEHFKDNNELPGGINDHIGEGCVSVTWIQLNYQLFTLTGGIKYLDELERTTYNHLTGAENPETGCVSYYTPLVGIKPYKCDITCCMSSVPRGIAMIPLFANGKINQAPSFFLYQPGVYTTSVDGKKLGFTTTGDFLKGEDLTIVVNDNNPVSTTVLFRKPYWANDFVLSVNGKKEETTNAGVITEKRIWKKGDKVTIHFTMPTIVLDGGKSYPNQIALQRGPQVLAFDKNINGFDLDGIVVNANNSNLEPQNTFLPKSWVGGESFKVKAYKNSSETNITLVPYGDASQTGGSISTWIKKQ